MKDYSIKINGHTYEVSIDKINDAANVANVVVNGTEYTVEIEGGKAPEVAKPTISAAPASMSVTPASAMPAAAVKTAAAPAGAKVIKAPLPGTVLSINVKAGDSVKTGQTVAVLEAMKMENNIDSEYSGVVKSVAVQNGATVMEGEILITIE